MANIRAIYRKVISDTSLTNKAALNGITSLIDYVVRMLVNLLVTPIIVLGLGDYLFGIWQLLSQFMTYLSFSSGHPSQTIKIVTATKQYSRDFDEKRRNVGSAIASALLFIPISLILGGFLVWFSPDLLKIPMELYNLVRWTTLILVFNLVLSSVIGLPFAVLKGENLGYKSIGYSVLISILSGGATVLVFGIGADIVGVALVTIFTSLISGGFYFYIAKRHVPWFGISKPKRHEVKAFLSLNIWVLMWQIINKLMSSVDVIILGFIESPDAVTSFSLTKYLSIIITNLVMVVIGNILPGLGGFVGTRQDKKVLKIRRDIKNVVWLISVTTGVTILAWNRSFVSLWVGDDHYFGTFVNLLIILMSIQLVFIRLDANILDLTLKIRKKTEVAIFSTILSIFFAWAFTFYWQKGGVGLCLGLISGRMVLSMYYPFLIKKFFDENLDFSILIKLRKFIVFMGLFIAAIYINSNILASSWLVLILDVLITIILSGFSVFTFGLSKEERNRVLSNYILSYFK